MEHVYLRIENAEGNVLIAVYLFVCVRVIRITQKVLNRIAWNLVRWLVIIRGPFDYILGSIGSKVKVKVMKRSTYSLNRMEFGGMIGYYPGTIWLDFRIDQVQGQEKVKIFFLP